MSEQVKMECKFVVLSLICDFLDRKEFSETKGGVSCLWERRGEKKAFLQKHWIRI